MKKVLLSIALCLSMATTAIAGGNIFNHLGVGVGVGTTGIDIELGTTCTNFLQFRAGVAIMPNFNILSSDVNISQSQWVDMQNKYHDIVNNQDRFSTEDQATIELMKTAGFMEADMPNKVDIQTKAKFGTSFKFLVDFFPIPLSSFHVTAGFYAGKSEIFDAYTTNCEEQLEAMTFYNEYLYGNTFTTVSGPRMSYSFDKEMAIKIGETNVRPNGPQSSGNIKVNSFRPYVGLGFGRIVPKKTPLSFAWDLGVQFWNTPTMVVNGTEIKSDGISDDNGGDAIKTISKITVFPVLNFRLTGKIF